MENQSQPAAASKSLSAKKVAIQLLLGIVALILGMAILCSVYKDQVTTLSKGFVDILGGLGVALAFFFTDAFPIPVPPDPVFAFAQIGGMTFVEMIVWAMAGSFCGGTLGFCFGRGFSHTRLFKRLMEGRSRRVYNFVRKYGHWGLIAAAITPIPYVAACYACGALKMPYKTFILISQVRWFRMTFYILLMRYGVINVMN